MPLGTEVGLGPGHIVLDGDLIVLDGYPALFSHEKGHRPPFPAHIYYVMTKRSPISAIAELLLLECGPMPNVMAALPNIGGALCSTPLSLADAQY